MTRLTAEHRTGDILHHSATQLLTRRPPFGLSCFQDDAFSITDMSALQAPLDIPIPDPPSPEDEVRTGFGSVTVTQVVVLCQRRWTRAHTCYLV